MESSSSNSEESELQQMQLEERELHQKCLAWFKELKSHLGNLHKFFEVHNTGPFEIAILILFHEEHQTFREKMYHNLNQLQWQLEIENLHSCDPKTCLDYLEEIHKLIDERVLKYGELRMKEREVQAIKEIEKRLKEREIHQKDFLFELKNEQNAGRRKAGLGLDFTAVMEFMCGLVSRRNLLRYLEELDKFIDKRVLKYGELRMKEFLDVLEKLIDERVLKYGELRMKEREVQAIKEIEKRLKEREIHQKESLVTEGTTLQVNLSIDGTTFDASLVTNGTTLDASLVTKGIALDASLVDKQSTVDSNTSSEQHDECNSSRNECNRSGNEN
ncbi:hypothetical protein Tco_0603927 [Tanacetum coccineum]